MEDQEALMLEQQRILEEQLKRQKEYEEELRLQEQLEAE